MIGPGSEWFWAAAQFFVVVISLVGLYRQLRQQNAANAVQRMEALQGEWNSQHMIQVRLRVAIWRKHATSVMPDFADQASLTWLCGFFENLSDLEEEGYLTWKEVENSWGPQLVMWWTVLAPTIQAERELTSPLVFGGFERLARRAESIMERRGDKWSIAEADIPEALDAQIQRNSARLRILRDVAAGEIPVDPPEATLADESPTPPAGSADGHPDRATEAS